MAKSSKTYKRKKTRNYHSTKEKRLNEFKKRSIFSLLVNVFFGISMIVFKTYEIIIGKIPTITKDHSGSWKIVIVYVLVMFCIYTMLSNKMCNILFKLKFSISFSCCLFSLILNLRLKGKTDWISTGIKGFSVGCIVLSVALFIFLIYFKSGEQLKRYYVVCKSKIKNLWKESVNITKIVFPSICFFLVTFCVFMPCSLFLGNIDEFLITFSKIIPCIIKITVLFFVLLLGIGILLKRDFLVYKYSVFVGSVAMGFYIQGNFLNPAIKALDGREIDWSQYRKNGIISIVVWILCLVLPQIFIVFKRELLMKIMKWGGYFFTSIQVVTLIFLIFTTKTKNYNYVLTKDGEFDLSSSENTIIFVLDTLDAIWFEDIILTDEQHTKYLKDFVYFDNVVSGGAPTILGMPTLLTGKCFDGEGSVQDYYNEVYSHPRLFSDLYKKQYKVKLYTSYNDIYGLEKRYINNCESTQEYIISSYGEFTKYLYQLVSFYAMPQILKQNFWLYSGDFQNAISVKEKELITYPLFDDAQFYTDFLKNGLNLEENAGEFVLYHLRGAHGPYITNENCEQVDESESSVNQQVRGVFKKIICEYLDEMKKKGIYDNSTIIITGDHGMFQLQQNPAVLIKPKGHQGEFCVNSTPATFANLQASMAASFLNDYSAYGSSLFEADENQQRLHTAIYYLGTNTFPENKFISSREYTQYIIPIDIRDAEKIKIYSNKH